MPACESFLLDFCGLTYTYTNSYIASEKHVPVPLLAMIHTSGNSLVVCAMPVVLVSESKVNIPYNRSDPIFLIVSVGPDSLDPDVQH